MNRSILDRYTKSIFRDPKHLMALSWLDRSGPTEEEEIAQDLGEDHEKIKLVLFELHKNGLIDYEKDLVMINPTGKLVIDNLGLSDSVVDSFLSSMRIPSKHKKEIEFFVSQYRDNAYNYYLNTQASIRLFKDFHALFFNPVSEVKSVIESIITATFTILIRDLRYWVRTSSKSLKTRLDLADSEFKNSEFMLSLTDDSSKAVSSYNRMANCVSTLGWIEDSDWMLETIQRKITNRERNDTEKVLLIFEFIQRRNTRETWYEQASEYIKKCHFGSGITSIDKALLAASSFTKDYIQDSYSFIWWWKDVARGYLHPSITESNSNALGLLLTSRSFDEFRHGLGIPDEAAMLLLRRVSSKSRSLLDDKTSQQDAADNA